MADTQKITVPTMAWYEDRDMKLEFPSSWEITECRMHGHTAPALSEDSIKKAFANPIGSKTIRELAKGKHEVVILFDDLSRPTPTQQLIPYVLEEMAAAGIPDDSIRFIAALGNHGAMDGLSLRKKLGDDVMERFLVYNHNPYENCTPLGKTSFGTPVEINSEFMSCDLRIGIGCIVPHRRAGFGGGAKMVLPGVSSITTTEANHSRVKYSDSTGIGCYDTNVCQLDMQEACQMARLDIKIDVLLNMKREISHIFIGEPMAEHAAGVKLASDFYATDAIPPMDIVVGNCYFKANEMVLAPGVLSALLKKEGGDMVLLVVTPEGQMVHYWSRSFGKKFGGRGWYQRTKLPVNTKRISVIAPYPDKVGLDWVAAYDQANRFRSWDGALKMLKETYGEKAKVAVVPDASVQYFPERKANKALL